ncbi:RIP metalloprotease RseP [Peptoniphilus sp. HMSC075B08]|uniref:RIP metalloprotease RseP n=1 Tax=Peptoniphilus sp. HMSC075B08 TaxID=1739525 RepID=UPI0008A57AC9|nr:RIP metalloprotease RseP [Peptoniphilus sp. HMSC075B08]OFO60135.1 RIP metalloprotease RseP [Peptoniphilus sp. HMSC075B08]
MITLISSLLVFLLVVMLHEFGHFSIAKLSGIKVNEFSIGMGPKIYQKQRGETFYSLRALPVGGYVAMEGEEENSHDPRAFNNVSIVKRMAVVLAGAFMNFVLAFIAFTLIFSIAGYGSNEIEKVISNSPADKAGIQSGDLIIKINENKVKDIYDINSIISKYQKEEMDFQINREGNILNVKIKPEYSVENQMYLIGIISKLDHSILKSISLGANRTLEMSKLILKSIKMMFSGSFKMEYLSGPVGVVQLIGSESSKGFLNFLQILGLISVNLGVFNLLPIPALDGGKFLFLLIEALRGKPIDEKIEQGLSLIGISLLFSLMIYVTIFNDIGRLFNK